MLHVFQFFCSQDVLCCAHPNHFTAIPEIWLEQSSFSYADIEHSDPLKIAVSTSCEFAAHESVSWLKKFLESATPISKCCVRTSGRGTWAQSSVGLPAAQSVASWLFSLSAVWEISNFKMCSSSISTGVHWSTNFRIFSAQTNTLKWSWSALCIPRRCWWSSWQTPVGMRLSRKLLTCILLHLQVDASCRFWTSWSDWLASSASHRNSAIE